MSLKSQIARWLYPLHSIRSVLRGPLKGARFTVTPGMGATYALGQDHWNFRVFHRHLRPGLNVYDIGANCGQMALFFSRQVGPGGRVLAFEPAPANVVFLRKNLALNRSENIKVIPAAVAADNETRRFCFDAGHHTMGSLEGAMVKLDGWSNTIEVPCVSLDSLVSRGEPPPDLMKIDVEGAGLEVIKGALEVIEKHRPPIYFELHAAEEQAPELQALRLLRDRFGYKITGLDGTMDVQLRPMWGPAVWCEPSPIAGRTAGSC